MYRVPDLKLVVMASKDHERVFKWVSRDFNIFQTLIRSSSLKEFWEPCLGFIEVCLSQTYYKKNIGDTVITISRGTFSFQELMEMGGIDDRQQVENVQKELQSDDPINIQYTSVSNNLTKM